MKLLPGVHLEIGWAVELLRFSPKKLFGPTSSGIHYIHSWQVQSAGLAGVSSEMGLDDGLLVCTLLLLI